MEKRKALESHTCGTASPQYYQPQDIPGLTRFPVKCHPQADQVCQELDQFFLNHWPWRSEHERKVFLSAELANWACMAYALAENDRIQHAAKLATLFFLVDDLAENASLEEGKAFFARLIPLAQGRRLPDRNDPLDWITYDTFASMRECDPQLTDDVVEATILYATAQVDEARLKCTDIGSLLCQRLKEAGGLFVAAILRFGMNVHLSTEVMSSLQEIHISYCKLATIANDIESFDKELHAWQTHGKEGAYMPNIVTMMAKDGGVSDAAAKRICYVLVRELEIEHERLVAKRLAEPDGSDESLRKYLYGLECVIGGNEAWSQTSARYHRKKE